MYKHGTQTSLTFKEDAPFDDYERVLVWNTAHSHSRKTAMNIKYRIKELDRLSGGDYKSILNDILKEIELELG